MPGQRASSGQYLSVRIGDSELGIPLLRVREILQYEAPAPIPGLPPDFRGVMNVRGTAVPVVDLGVRLGRAAAPVTKRTCIVVIEGDASARPIAVVADGVNEVVELREEDVQPPPDFGPDLRVDFLTGMARSARTFLILLDLDRVLSAAGHVRVPASDGAPAPA
jgi:purine-binding chemotaxis protein CheW